MSNSQPNLFSDDISANNWADEWIGMPEYNNVEEAPPVITATFKFRSDADFEEFLSLIKQHVYSGERPFDGMQRKDVKSTWYPLKEKASKYVYRDESKVPGIHNK